MKWNWMFGMITLAHCHHVHIWQCRDTGFSRSATCWLEVHKVCINCAPRGQHDYSILTVINPTVPNLTKSNTAASLRTSFVQKKNAPATPNTAAVHVAWSPGLWLRFLNTDVSHSMACS